MVYVAGEAISHAAGEEIRREINIRVGEENPFPVSGFQAFLEGVHFAEPAIGQFRDADDAKIGKLEGKAVGNLRRGICGAVVHEDKFRIGIIAFESGKDGGFKMVGFVAGGYDDGDKRRLWR